MVPGKQLFSTASCAFGLQRRDSPRWQTHYTRDLQGNWLFAWRAQSYAKTYDFWAGPLFGFLKRNEHRRGQGKITDLDGKTPSEGKLTDKIKSLSKGNQQKVQLIITLIHEPKLIILDEPFSGLDPVNTEVLKQVIFEEKSVGRPLSFLTTSWPMSKSCVMIS